jgi:MYXO-CTERM domain-containing protein
MMKEENKNNLFKYAAAAGAGAFSVSSANAAVIVQSSLDGFTPITLVNGSSAFDLDIDGDSDVDLSFNVNLGFTETASVFEGDGLALAPSDTDNAYPFGFAFNDIVDGSAFDSTEPAPNDRYQNFLGRWQGDPVSGYLINNVSSGYLGVEFDNGGNTHFGWVELAISSPAPGEVQLDISRYAWENTPGQGIAVPEPSNYALGLGLLALGAAGVRSRRRSI